MEIPSPIADAVTALDRAEFAKVRDPYLRPLYDLTGLKLLREKAGRERDLRELYRDRAPYELLQNADDAGARRAVFLLTPEGLCFAHSGKWFTVANLKNLADGWSDKDPKECIGHKGLGFRSVLDITPAPHVVALCGPEFFGFKFSWAVNHGHILETLRRVPSLAQVYEQWTSRGQSVCPVMAIPGEARLASMGVGAAVYKELRRGAYGSDLTTMLWLPAEDRDGNRLVTKGLGVQPFVSGGARRQWLASFVEKDVPDCLPFLSNLEAVSLYVDGVFVASASTKGARKSESGDELTVCVTSGHKRGEAAYFQMHGSAPIPPNVRNDPLTPVAVHQMETATFRLSVRLEDGQPVFDPSAVFHVYFPTDEPTGFGFVVHGDFFVKPDRTRLMDGVYNRWLLKMAAEKFSSEFLTKMFERYHGKDVLESLRPSANRSHVAELLLFELAERALQVRTAPFLPGAHGPLLPSDVALPTSPDPDGVWQQMFSGSVGAVTKKAAFLAPDADSENARVFLGFAGVEPLSDTAVLSLAEDCAKAERTIDWWYKLFEFLARNRATARWSRADVAGRAILPDEDLRAIKIPAADHPLLCLPPSDVALAPNVPQCFRDAFLFVNSSLGERLQSGPEDVRRWVMSVCGVVRFEASELLPRAIAATAGRFYDGTITLSAREIALLWDFIQRIIAPSRGIASSQFWNTIGRLPLPLALPVDADQAIATAHLAPAFLCYWPDGDGESGDCLSGVAGLRRLAPEFLAFAASACGGLEPQWRSLLRQAGVSGAPKRLRYAREVGAREVPFTAHLASEPGGEAFSGERQRDENIVALENMQLSSIWREYVESFAEVERAGRALHEVRILDRLEACVAAAEAAWREADPGWVRRLWGVARQIPDDDIPDQLFRRAHRGGGDLVGVKSFLRAQTESLPWAPSSRGPVSASEGFLRFSSRRFVSRGQSEDELGDLLVPYVVANTPEDYAHLQRLGFEALEDASATPQTLARFLTQVGSSLSEAWARESILNSRGRWRLVRGAIQENYRALNQAEEVPAIPVDAKFVSHVGGRIELRQRPLYYAEPGSAIQRAFQDALPLLDADRPYGALFRALGVRRLESGESVTEEFCGDSGSIASPPLYRAILDELGPYLLSVVIAKSEARDHHDLVRRRLRERFDVRVADRLTVKFRMQPEGEAEWLERSVDFPKFYLRRRSVEGAGAIRELHFTLYVVGTHDVQLHQLDGDALGDALAPVFFEGTGDDHAALFPRIVSRYQNLVGSRPGMEEFLFESLGVPRETQGLARDDLTGTPDQAPPVPLPPPRAVIVTDAPTAGAVRGDEIERKLSEQATAASERVGRFIESLSEDEGGQGKESATGRAPGREGGVGGPTLEQRVRGRTGEEEFLRRITQPYGWEGFALVRDARMDGKGYDFVCTRSGREVRVEVKTFAWGGRVVVTAGELRAASEYPDDYFLVGLLDDGEPTQWWSAVLQNPLPRLLESGSFDVGVELQAEAADLFPGGDEADAFPQRD